MIRVFIAAVVAAFGLAFYAAATLLWDRRNVFRRWLGRRKTSAETAPPAGPGALAAAIGVLLVVGTGLILGSCIGLIFL